jgi:subtilisin family serine protease
MAFDKRRKIAADDMTLGLAGIKAGGGVVSNGYVVDPGQGTFTANFDDFLDRAAGVEAGYGNLIWRNVSYYTLASLGPSATYGNTGYAHHIVSGDHAAFGGGSNAIISMSSGGANFTLSSLSVGGAWRNGMTVQIIGYDDGVVTHTTNVVVDVAAPDAVVLGWTNVDRVTFQSSGGTAAPGVAGTGTQFVLDDIVFGGALGSISGTVWHDRDGNGVFTANKDRAIEGRVVYIDADGDGILDAGESFTTTAADGSYSFSGLAFGSYVIREVLPKRWVETAPTQTIRNYDAVETSGGFVDISATGTLINPGDTDEGYTALGLTSPITLFGQSLSSLYVSANGFISTTVPTSSSWQNGHLPNATVPNIIAPFWDDLVIGAGGGMYMLDDTANDRLIVQWSGMIPYQGTAVSTFQAMIYGDGTITYNYLGAADGGISATIGMALGAGNGIEYSFNTASVDAGTTITFTPTAETELVRDLEVTLDQGAAVTGVDFASHNPKDAVGTITGTAFHDKDGDGVFGAGDVAKAGWTVFLDDNGNGRHDIGEAETVTNGRGGYTFSAVAPGEHEVVISSPLTWEQLGFDTTGPTRGAAIERTPLERLQAAVAAAQADTAASGHVYASADFDKAHLAGQLVVKMDGAATLAAGGDGIDALMASVGATRIDSTVALGLELWSVKGDLQAASDALMKSGLVTYAQPNYVITADAVSAPVVTDDPGNDLTWGLDAINAPEAWNYSTGSRDVVVGVIDTGVDLDHPDLIANLWTNTGEIAGDGIDNDGNGYVDDIHGYDFADNDGNPDDAINGHGTHVSGTIGGVGDNGIGVSGVNQAVSIMALRFIGASGSGSSFNAARAVEYATMMGADLTNNSWGGGPFDNAVHDAIAAGPLFVASAGNGAFDNDGTPYYPQGYDLDNVISVAATGETGLLSGFSQWGLKSVDIAAPGVAIWSTLPLELGSYAFYDGTSMAAPHVAGAAALLLSIFPDLTAVELKAALMAGVNHTGDLSKVTISGGILDIMGAIEALGRFGQTVTVTAGGTATVDFAATGGASETADTLTGFAYGERIAGLGGDDVIDGGAGDDVLTGGAGSDTLTGGAGADRFVFGRDVGEDIILDFSEAEGDRIVIAGRGFGFASLTIGESGDGDALVSFGATSIELDGILPGAVTAGMFAFAAPPSASSFGEALLPDYGVGPRALDDLYALGTVAIA